MEIHIEKREKPKSSLFLQCRGLGFFVFLHINKGVDQH
jgi:hypothetical protein